MGSGKFHASLGHQEIDFKPFSVTVCHLRELNVSVAEMKAIEFFVTYCSDFATYSKVFTQI